MSDQFRGPGHGRYLQTPVRGYRAVRPFQEAMRALGREVRHLDGWQYQRVDAYRGWEDTRDVGAGVDMTGWLDEVERFLDGQDET